jgi:hypothetical protein
MAGLPGYVSNFVPRTRTGFSARSGASPRDPTRNLHCGNRDEVVEGVIDADPIAAVRAVGGAKGVDGNRLGASGSPCRNGGRRVAKSKA